MTTTSTTTCQGQHPAATCGRCATASERDMRARMARQMTERLREAEYQQRRREAGR